jgi:ribosomal protein L37AE/L43A
MKEFLRRCPSCGKRFVVRLESKKVVDVQKDSERIIHNVVTSPYGLYGGRVTPPVIATTVEEVPIEREEFDLTYQCKHCKHEWTETVTKIERL